MISMKDLSRSIALFLLTVSHLTASINVECRYGPGSWAYLDNIYWCSVQNDLGIKSRETSIITSVNGTHSSGKGNDDVHVLIIVNNTVNYFPKGIEKFFKNLHRIEIRHSALQEIKQSDFSAFPDLAVLHLDTNNLKVLEYGLFDFNPKLAIIALHNNKISQIFPGVFNNLKQLTTLYLDGNTCINMYAEDDATKVQNIIQLIESSCPYFEQNSKNYTFTVMKIET